MQTVVPQGGVARPLLGVWLGLRQRDQEGQVVQGGRLLRQGFKILPHDQVVVTVAMGGRLAQFWVLRDCTG